MIEGYANRKAARGINWALWTVVAMAALAALVTIFLIIVVTTLPAVHP